MTVEKRIRVVTSWDEEGKEKVTETFEKIKGKTKELRKTVDGLRKSLTQISLPPKKIGTPLEDRFQALKTLSVKTKQPFAKLVDSFAGAELGTEQWKRKTIELTQSIQLKNKALMMSKKRLGSLQDLSVKTGVGLEKLTKRFKGVRQGTLKWKQEIKSVTDKALPKFNMAWLSIMFGGMAIQRTFGRIQRATVKTFTDVMSTVEGASTNVGKLSAHFEYLKFTIGSAIDNALGPFMPMIINLVTWFANLVEQHPEAVFWAIAGAFAAGTALAVGGSFMLFVGGIATLATQLASGGAIQLALGKAGWLTKAAGIGIGLYFMKESIEDMKEGKFLDGVTNMLLSTTSFAWAAGTLKTKTALGLAVGTYFLKETIENIKEGNWMDAVADALISAGSFMLIKSPYLGGFIIALGFTLKYREALASEVTKAMKWFEEKLLTPMGNRLRDLYSKWKLLGIMGEELESRQLGGRISQEGLYHLHQGEEVVPANRVNMGGVTINVSGAGNPSLVAEMVLSKIQQYTST